MPEREIAVDEDPPHVVTGQRPQSSRPADSGVTARPSSPQPSRPRVLIVGGGVAGLETLLALRALLGDRVEITIVAPEGKFVNRSMTVAEPSKPRWRSGPRLDDIATDLDANWHRGTLERVEHERQLIVTTDDQELPYDRLVLALGARPPNANGTRGTCSPITGVAMAPSTACCFVCFMRGGSRGWRTSSRPARAGPCRSMTWR